MKAAGCTKFVPIDGPGALLELELPEPEPGAREMLAK